MRRTAYITVVLDARRDMWEIGNGPEHDEPFTEAYRDSARRLQSAVNRRLGGHSIDISVSEGSYEGPAMQDNDQPENINVWQELHNMTIGDGTPDGWSASVPSDSMVECLREWALDQIRSKT